MKVYCLDHGFVELVNSMGDDKFICDVARHTTQKEAKTEQDNINLINYLMKHEHTSPFEFVNFVFKVKAPIFVARQWFRHRTGSYSEISGRYTELPTEFYIPDKQRIKGKGILNRQGSEGDIGDILKENWLTDIDKLYSNDKKVYDLANEFGISNELSRITLPVSTYTQFYWKIDLHNLLHFLKLRMDWHAQYEIQQYAGAILGLIKEIVPFTVEAFYKYQMNSVTLSQEDISKIEKLLDGPGNDVEIFKKIIRI